jgi:hypothetical protein
MSMTQIVEMIVTDTLQSVYVPHGLSGPVGQCSVNLVF